MSTEHELHHCIGASAQACVPHPPGGEVAAKLTTNFKDSELTAYLCIQGGQNWHVGHRNSRYDRPDLNQRRC